jgi:hypothetical protein
MSEELRALFKEAERRGDRKTAEAILVRLEEQKRAQATPQPAQERESFIAEQPTIGPFPVGYGTGLSRLFNPQGQQYSQPGMTHGDIPGTMQDIQTGLFTPAQGRSLIIAEAIERAAMAAGEKVAEITPESVKNFLGYAGRRAIQALPEELVEKATEVGGDIEQWKRDNPLDARNAEAMLTLGGMALPGAQSLKLGRRWFFLEDVVKPYSNKANRKAALEQMKVEGLFQRKVFPPDAVQGEMMSALKTVPGIKKGNIISKNYAIIRDHITESAQNLQGRLDKMQNVKVSRRELERTLKKAAKNVNSAYVESKRMDGTEMQIFVNDVLGLIGNVRSPGDLLRARKAVDEQFRRFSSDRRMDGKLTPTREEMQWRAARDSLNALLEMKAPGSRQELRRQHLLFKTLDVLADKAEWEGDTIYQRQIKPRIPFLRNASTTLMPRQTN